MTGALGAKSGARALVHERTAEACRTAHGAARRGLQIQFVDLGAFDRHARHQARVVEYEAHDRPFALAVLVSIRPLAPMVATATDASAPAVQPLLWRNCASASSVMNNST